LCWLRAFKRAACSRTQRSACFGAKGIGSEASPVSFFIFCLSDSLLFFCPLLTPCWSHNSSDVYIHTAPAQHKREDTRRRREPTTHKKSCLFFFVLLLLQGVSIYTYKYMAQELPALAS